MEVHAVEKYVLNDNYGWAVEDIESRSSKKLVLDINLSLHAAESRTSTIPGGGGGREETSRRKKFVIFANVCPIKCYWGLQNIQGRILFAFKMYGACLCLEREGVGILGYYTYYSVQYLSSKVLQ